IRLVIEKPYGRDLESATQLDQAVHEAFDEEQIYRIDHYMGKETVQNVLALRFANATFEPIWNRRYVAHVQVTVAESLGVEHRSTTETFVAMRLLVDNWRWAGVPVYVRTGKRLPKRVTEVAMQFQRVPHLPFAGSLSEGLEPNTIVLRVQPDEGITFRFGA